MTKTVEFFFDIVSLASYLAWTQLPDLAQRCGAEIRWRPMLLGGVFKATGNISPVAVPAKGRYMVRDMTRFAERYGVALNMNPHFPINSLHLMRGATALLDTPDFHPYLKTLFEGMWVERRDMSDPDTVADCLARADIDPSGFQALIQDETVKQRLRVTTEEAVERGAFGAPTFFVDGEMFFGQDRLDFVREALSA